MKQRDQKINRTEYDNGANQHQDATTATRLAHIHLHSSKSLSQSVKHNMNRLSRGCFPHQGIDAIRCSIDDPRIQILDIRRVGPNN